MLFLPSTIQTILSASELHRVMLALCSACLSIKKLSLPKEARGLYHRSGIHLQYHSARVTLPRRLLSCDDYNITACTARRILF